jgi:hypothetical protein
MEHDVYVVQVISDGCKGYPSDEVAEIAVCALDMKASDCDCVYDELLFMEPTEMGKSKLDYLDENAGIHAEDLYNGVRLDDVVREVRAVLKGKDVASFDVRNVFYGYLLCMPWDMTGEFSIMPAVSARMERTYKTAAIGEENAQIRKAYGHYCPDDPMDVGDGRRALDLAQMTAALAFEMRRRGLYRSEFQHGEYGAEYGLDRLRYVGGQVDQPEYQRYYEGDRGPEPSAREYHPDREHQAGEYQQPCAQEDPSLGVPEVLVDQSEPQDAEQAGDQREYRDERAVLGSGLPRRLRLGDLFARYLPVALRARQAVGRHGLSAVRAFSGSLHWITSPS